MSWRMDRSESIGEFKVTNCDLKDKSADDQHQPPYKAQLGRGQAVATQIKLISQLGRGQAVPSQIKTNQTPSAPPQV